MKKKLFFIVLVILVLTSALIILTGCDSSKDDSTSKAEQLIEKENLEESILTLKLYEDEYFQAKIAYSKKLTVLDDDPDDDEITLKNEKDNYEAFFYVTKDESSTYYGDRDIAKDNSEIFKEETYGEYEGYYYTSGNSKIEGAILLEGEDEDSYKYIVFEIDAIEDYKDDEWIDMMTIYNLKDIQNILNSFGYRYKTIEE